MVPMRKVVVGALRFLQKLFQPRNLPVIILAIVAATILFSWKSEQNLWVSRSQQVFSDPKLNSLEFVKYIPSELEQDWWDKKELYQADPSKICQDLASHSEMLSLWISTIKDKTIPKESVFSTLEYRKESGEIVSRMIEPLVGHFRHPFALEHCKPASISAVDVQDRSYIAFGGLPGLNKSVYPGKRYLFDLGTADFATSIGYFISIYRSLGIDFDRIWAWEAGPRPNYWKSVPAEVQARLHFYNYPISSDTQSPSHPLEILKSIYMPGDYIVRQTFNLYCSCLQIVTS